jgi:hypothetical protein
MRISIYADDGRCLWEFAINSSGQSAGHTSPAFLPEVVAALRIALAQSEGQLGCPLYDIDAVPNGGRTAPEINRNVPMPGVWNDDFCRKVIEVPTVVAETAVGPVVTEISIVRKQHIAAVRAVHNDDIASV